ncbi:MAG: T9SS type A sorting domain-containing protein [Bacteroidales bacterium]|nr:T9SS type A sorting domain-containing protein [Bacteroidales bacterium]
MRKSLYFLFLMIACFFVGNQSFAQNFALQFDGDDDEITVADDATLNPTDALTVEVWIKADKWEDAIHEGTIIGKQVGEPDRGYCLTAAVNGTAEFSVSINESWEKATTDEIMVIGTWYHLAGVYDGSTVKIYVNGVLQSTTEVTGTHSVATGTDLYIGENPTWGGRNFEGTIDDIRIWNIARTETEISDYYEVALIGTEIGLVSYWTLNEGTGITVADTTSNTNDGTLTGMEENDWVPSFNNKALRLDGVDDRLGIDDAASLNPTDALTLEVWIKADKWENAIYEGTIIGKQVGEPDRGYCLSVGEGGRVEFTVSIDEGWASKKTDPVMGIGSWYHIAGVYDGSTVKTYINGILQTTVDVTGTHSVATGTTLFLGDNPTWPGRNFEGTIDEVRIWNVARTETEINDNYTKELAGTETGLAAYWNCNEGTGLTADDLAADLNQATLLDMEESAWVSGFVVPNNDIGIVGIVSPYQIGSDFTSDEKVIVEVKNFATSSVTNFDISYELNGGTTVTETVSESIEAFGTYIHEFAATVDLSGSASCVVKAYTSLDGDGMAENDTTETTIEPAISSMIFDAVQHSFSSAGQLHVQSVYINEDLSEYSQILLNIDLECPAGGCDPWDQAAQMYIKKDNVEYEIARYITPYGVACGDWTFDLTDFRSILTGSVEFISYIQVWGPSGWLVNAELELVPGTPEYQNSKIQKLWEEDRWVYGDVAVNAHNPEAISLTIGTEAEAAKIRLTTTGHGQANTDNAAEFMEATHNIYLDGTQTFEQHLWKEDCATNTCTGQLGTFQYSRAGWCPGQDVQPMIFDMEGKFTAGQTIEFDYQLQEYTNLENTAYDNGGHTEPFNRMFAYLVTYSDKSPETTSIVEFKERKYKVYPNPSSGIVNIISNEEFKSEFEIIIYNVNGQEVYTRCFSDVYAGELKTINTNNLHSGLYYLVIKTGDSQHVEKLFLQ